MTTARLGLLPYSTRDKYKIYLSLIPQCTTFGNKNARLNSFLLNCTPPVPEYEPHFSLDLYEPTYFRLTSSSTENEKPSRIKRGHFPAASSTAKVHLISGESLECTAVSESRFYDQRKSENLGSRRRSCCKFLRAELLPPKNGLEARAGLSTRFYATLK